MKSITLNNAITYLLIIAGFILLYFALKGGNGDKVTVELKYDSIPHAISNSTIEKPIVYKAGEINLPPSVIQVLNSSTMDTALLYAEIRKLSKELYSVVTQKVVSEDDSLMIETIDTLSENKILGRKLTYKIKFPVQHITNNPKLRNRVYIGGSVQSGVHLFEAINADVYLVTKKNTLYRVNYNLLDLAKGQPYSFGAGAGFKIGKWK